MHEHKTITASNMAQCQRVIADSFMKGGGKIAVLFSCKQEFIFGDGFYSNLSSSTRYSFGRKMLVPITPQIAVLYANPRRYVEHPKLVAIDLSDEEICTANTTVQLYAKNALLFKTEAPCLLDVFRSGSHMIYVDENADPVTDWIQQLSGVSPHRGLYGF